MRVLCLKKNKFNGIQKIHTKYIKCTFTFLQKVQTVLQNWVQPFPNR